MRLPAINRRALRPIATSSLIMSVALINAAHGWAVVVQAEWQIPVESFDQWIFQNNGNSRQAKKNLESLLTLQIVAVDDACGLTEAQRRKLELAGAIDIRGFFDRVERVRDRFMEVRLDQEKFNKANIWQQISPLQQEFAAGIFGMKSFYQKVRRSTLTEPQRRAFNIIDLQRREFAYEAKIRLALVTLENAAPMTHKQREAFVELVLKQTPAPLRFGQNDQHYVYYQLSRLSTHDVVRILESAQAKSLNKIARQHRSRRAFLIQQGFLVGDAKPVKRSPDDVPLGEPNMPKFNLALQRIIDLQEN
ncbi:hypothetical protein OAS39_02500 [Pirellulales bacterium]|nr:hypothetical protein [Pirellulales bacterium]